MMSTLANIKSLHFIGIGGAGMSALAELAHEKGLVVTGSDLNESYTTKRLRDQGIKIFSSHDANNMPLGVDAVVYSSAIKADNLEFEWAIAKKIPVIHRSELLSSFLEKRKAIVVAGTHGKTTTTAMIYHMLCSCGLDPGLYLGGRILGTNKSSHLGTSDYFVVEADESDGSFLNYSPFVSVITNIDEDHLDFYHNLDSVKKAFEKFLGNTHPEGFCVLGWDNQLCRDISQNFFNHRIAFGLNLGCDIRPLAIEERLGIIHYRIIVEKNQISGKLPLIGQYNLQNFLCCLGVGHGLQLDLKKITAGFAHFTGVERRLSRLYDSEKLTIIDDYAHNPGKIASVVQAARKSWPQHQLIVVFQAHRYSRLRTMYQGFCSSFLGADLVFVLPIFSAGEANDGRFTPTLLAADIEQRSQIKSIPCEDLSRLGSQIQAFLKPPTLILTVGAGDINHIAQALVEEISDDLDNV